MNHSYVLSEQVGGLLAAQNLLLVTAESCTGGGVAQIITEVAGSSQWFDRGFVTYSNQAKMEMLGVSAITLAEFGAVSEHVAKEMALGALSYSNGHVSLAITGIAGPTGGSLDKPIGLVWFAWAFKSGIKCFAQSQKLSGHRKEIREQAVHYALTELIRLLEAHHNSL